MMVSWVGLRGAAPIVLATFPLLAAVSQANMVFNLVFFIVITSAILHGTSIPFIARMLDLAAPAPSRSRFGMEMDQKEDQTNELIEMEIPHGSPVINKQIVNIGLPSGTLIVLIAKGKDQISPTGSTVIECKDTLLVLTATDKKNEVRQLILGDNAIVREPELDIPDWWFGSKKE
jgi:cell volume regulation protein A